MKHLKQYEGFLSENNTLIKVENTGKYSNGDKVITPDGVGTIIDSNFEGSGWISVDMGENSKVENDFTGNEMLYKETELQLENMKESVGTGNKFIAVLHQSGGCDYTIECGTKVIDIDGVTNMEEAKSQLKQIMAEEYTGDSELVGATIYEVISSASFQAKYNR